MKERPIIFSAPMVRALLDGRKTQTRRAVKHQPPSIVSTVYLPFLREPNNWQGFGADLIHWYGQCPYGVPGDLLWVRERHCFLDVTKSALSKFPLGPENNNERGPDVWNVTIEYSGGEQHEMSVEGEKPKQTRQRGEIGWRSPIHMPRWASRITLEITDVRGQRLQDTTRLDIAAEGWPMDERQEGQVACVRDGIFDDDTIDDAAYEWYADVWDSINGKGAWDANPWIWALTFKVVDPVSPKAFNL